MGSCIPPSHLISSQLKLFSMNTLQSLPEKILAFYISYFRIYFFYTAPLIDTVRSVKDFTRSFSEYLSENIFILTALSVTQEAISYCFIFTVMGQLLLLILEFTCYLRNTMPSFLFWNFCFTFCHFKLSSRKKKETNISNISTRVFKCYLKIFNIFLQHEGYSKFSIP